MLIVSKVSRKKTVRWKRFERIEIEKWMILEINKCKRASGRERGRERREKRETKMERIEFAAQFFFVKSNLQIRPWSWASSRGTIDYLWFINFRYPDSKFWITQMLVSMNSARLYLVEPTGANCFPKTDKLIESYSSCNFFKLLNARQLQIRRTFLKSFIK